MHLRRIRPIFNSDDLLDLREGVDLDGNNNDNNLADLIEGNIDD